MGRLIDEPDASGSGREVDARDEYIEVFGEDGTRMLSIDLSPEDAPTYSQDIQYGIWERLPSGDYKRMGWSPPR